MSADDDRSGSRPPEPTAGPASPGEPGEPEAPAARPIHPAVRWLARLAVVAVALRFITQGLGEQWAGADEVATGFTVLAVVLGVCAAVLALVELARRGWQG